MSGLIDDDGNRPEKGDEEDAGEEEEEEEVEGGGGGLEEEESAEDDSFDSDDSLGEPQEIPQKLPRLNAVYNSIALHDKLEEIGWTDGIDWIQTLGVSYDQPDEIDVDDDLTREMAFYTQALEATRKAYTKLQELGLPFLRPDDYYAEMVKSDTHMLKVKDKLLAQQKQYEEVDARRKSREAKRFGKEVQAQKLKERAQQKKQNIDSVKKWRKTRQKDGFSKGEDEFPVGFEDEEPSNNKKRKLNAAHDDRPGGNSGQGLPRNKEGAAVGERPLGKISGSGLAFKGNVAPWDRSGGKNTGSFSGNKGDSKGGKVPWDRSGGKSRGSFIGNKGDSKSGKAPWDRSGGKNRGSFTGNKVDSRGGKAPWDRTGDKFSESPGNFKRRKGGKAAWDRTGDKFGESPGNFKRSKGRNEGGAKSRSFRNAKYGYGGKKGFKKQNTAESSDAGGGYKGRFKGNKGKHYKG